MGSRALRSHGRAQRGSSPPDAYKNNPVVNQLLECILHYRELPVEKQDIWMMSVTASIIQILPLQVQDFILHHTGRKWLKTKAGYTRTEHQLVLQEPADFWNVCNTICSKEAGLMTDIYGTVMIENQHLISFCNQ